MPGTIQRVVKVGDVTLAKVGHGLMTMTWTHAPVSDEVAFESIKASLDSVPPGVKMMLNGGEFYGNAPNFTANLDLISRFFEKYPEYADKAFLSVKGAINAEKLHPDVSPENLRKSVLNSISHLRGFKKIDLFEPARIDANVPLEVQMNALKELRDEGLFDYIGLSETSAETLRKAHSVVPVTMVEIEISPISFEEETVKVINTAAELGITIAAYSPVGRGLLTGALTKLEDLDPNDIRRRFTRFQQENFEHNANIASVLKTIAEPKGLTVAQLAIAWVSAKGEHIIPIPGSSRKERTEENLGATDVVLTDEEVKQVDEAVAGHALRGGRGIDGLEKVFRLWA